MKVQYGDNCMSWREVYKSVGKLEGGWINALYDSMLQYKQQTESTVFLGR
jgi:hypothetical protein